MGGRSVRTRLQYLLELVQGQGKASLFASTRYHSTMLIITPGLHVTWIRKEGKAHLLNIVPLTDHAISASNIIWRTFQREATGENFVPRRQLVFAGWSLQAPKNASNGYVYAAYFWTPPS